MDRDQIFKLRSHKDQYRYTDVKYRYFASRKLFKNGQYNIV